MRGIIAAIALATVTCTAAIASFGTGWDAHPVVASAPPIEAPVSNP
jgi:hypothetical protein